MSALQSLHRFRRSLILSSVFSLTATAALATDAQAEAIGASPVHSDACATEASINGVEQLWRNPELRWLIIGEVHGSNEIPAFFLRTVCQAALTNRPLVVGLEQDQSGQAALDAWIAAPANSIAEDKARQNMLAGPVWTKVQDGRASAAMMRLLVALKSMKTAGRISAIRLFRPDEELALSDSEHERAMADAWTGSSPNASTLLIALTGNLHAISHAQPDAPYRYAAQYLPLAATLTLNAGSGAGEVWACPTPANCGVQSWAGTVPSPPHGRIVLTPATDRRPWDGEAFMPSQLTPSPPQIAESE